MASNNTHELTDHEFQQKISESDKPVLIDFWAPWCGPCLILGPIIDEVVTDLKEQASFYKVNVDDNPQSSGQYGIMSIPTVIIFKKGEVKEMFVGVQNKDVYIEAIKKHLD